MKSLLVSNALASPTDEGIRKFSQQVGKVFVEHGITVISVPETSSFLARKLLLSRELAVDIRNTSPHIVIYVPAQSATLASIVRAAILRAVSRAKVILISLQPHRLSAIGALVARSLTLDLVLSPSIEECDYLRELGLQVAFLPMGVDTVRFTPVRPGEKAALRRKYNLPENRPIILHVGHFKTLRNLDLVAQTQERLQSTVLVVGGTSTGINQDVLQKLRSAGVRTIVEFVPHIEEIYQLADCYAFPVLESGGAIGVPLSVLEAMACNLPVVTTPFGGLPRMFTEGDGLFYADEEHQFVSRVQQALTLPSEQVKTRERTLLYSWEHITRIILEKAQELCTPN